MAEGSEGEDAGNNLPKPRDRPGTFARLLPEACQVVGMNPAGPRALDPTTARADLSRSEVGLQGCCL